MTGRLIAVLLLALGLAAGYGGVELGWSLVDYGPEADWLNEINRKQKGADTVNPSRPILWLGGHGGGHAGPVTIGGRGGLTFRHLPADSVELHFAGVQVAFDLGWQYAPMVYLAVRPGVELVGSGWGHYVHDPTSPFTDPRFRRLFVGWTMGMMPAIEIMGRLPRDQNRYVGLFFKTGYFVPLHGPDWHFHKPPPEFSLRGVQLQLGLRFGRLTAGR